MGLRLKHVFAALLVVIAIVLYFPHFMIHLGVVDGWHPWREAPPPSRPSTAPSVSSRKILQRQVSGAPMMTLTWRETGEIEKCETEGGEGYYSVEWAKEGFKVRESGWIPDSLPPEVDAWERTPGPDQRVVEAFLARIAAVVGDTYARENYVLLREDYRMSDDRNFHTPGPFRRRFATKWEYRPATRLDPGSRLHLELDYSLATGADTGVDLADAHFRFPVAELANGKVVEPKVTREQAILAAAAKTGATGERTMAKLRLENVPPTGGRVQWDWLVRWERPGTPALNVIVDASSGQALKGLEGDEW